MKETLFKCPLCQLPLCETEKEYICKNNHTYDKAKSGYVNLMLVTDKNSKLPGDNKLMVNSRHDFLNKNYYKNLSDCLNKMILSANHNNCIILDCGCGEGYYTASLKKFLNENNIKGKYLGIDISKFAIDKAAKRDNSINYAVASVFHMPVLDNCIDCAINIFAPFAKDEYMRVLKKDGSFFMVIPAKYHLWELKKAVYTNPIPNEVKDYEIEGFNFIEKQSVEYKIDLTSNDDIKALFMMTPYYYKTSKENFERLELLTDLTTTVSFEILKYTKK